ncbi:DUF4232 domain-containing protein [Bordetella bronchialis]|uniref:DUF4232 domain-containing protein n=1 Tax=Bordetella bronchialis TaxID=463025 RepID=A0A193FZK4_9BORD|nr:DUF4232 domain-containing protein [Bordetella bronchialis]ANN67532.1 hypothetical protein BAU06_15590 [Bordetella bronchialis]ANN72621.1 hypothetical protein BAU08_15820 [Bordetella bronchialis]
MNEIIRLRASVLPVLGSIALAATAVLGPAAARAEPACDPAQLSFAVDREAGQFDGMSHSGTLLVLRNLGPDTCTVPARPEVRFLDAGRQPLPVVAQVPPGMHPGPVIPPVAVPAGAELTSEARWVSSDAYGDGNCVTVAYATLAIGPRGFEAPLRTRMCGPANKSPTYGLTLLRRDPVYRPAPR